MTTEKNQRPIWSQKRQFVSDLDASENWWLSLEVLYIGIDGSSDGNLPDLSPPLVVERRKTSEPSSMSNIDWLQWSPCRLSQTIGISVSFFILSEWGEWTHMQIMYPSLQRDDPSCGEWGWWTNVQMLYPSLQQIQALYNWDGRKCRMISRVD